MFKLVPPKVLGSAYGISQCGLNIGLAFGPILVGGLTFNEMKENKYIWVNISLGIFCTVGIIFSVILLIYNKLFLGSILQKPTRLCTCPQKSSPILSDLNPRISTNTEI